MLSPPQHFKVHWMLSTTEVTESLLSCGLYLRMALLNPWAALSVT